MSKGKEGRIKKGEVGKQQREGKGGTKRRREMGERERNLLYSTQPGEEIEGGLVRVRAGDCT